MPLWARVYDGDFAFRQLYLQLARRTFPNLFDKCGPFQVDGNFGATAGIAEMLLHSHQRLDSETHVIHVLPALPKAWRNGSVKGLRARGGFEVDIAWADGALVSVELRSKRGSPLRLRHGQQTVDLKTDAGSTYRFDGALQRLP
jgi:alpha-L-fucosidase 2